MKENKGRRSSSDTHSSSDILQSSGSSSSHNIAVSESALRLRPDAITIDIGLMHAQSTYTTGLVFQAVASGSSSPLLDAAHKVRVYNRL
jgi:ATP phosphoribosyltransferase regulatory subunit HisZ